MSLRLDDTRWIMLPKAGCENEDGWRKATRKGNAWEAISRSDISAKKIIQIPEKRPIKNATANVVVKDAAWKFVMIYLFFSLRCCGYNGFYFEEWDKLILPAVVTVDGVHIVQMWISGSGNCSQCRRRKGRRGGHRSEGFLDALPTAWHLT